MFNGTIRTIEKVRHVKDLKNISSLGQIDSLAHKTYVENGIIKIVKGALALMKVEKIGTNLFMFKGKHYKKLLCVSHQIEKIQR